MTAEPVAHPIPRPGDGLLHPVALLALAVLVVNDHVLKVAWPSVVTGKLSDIAGLVVAPLALQSAWEVGLWVSGRWDGPSSRVLAVAIIAVAIAFVAVQVWPPATDLYRSGLGAALGSFRALATFLTGAPSASIVPVQAIGDAEDLLVLPALAITWWVGRRRRMSAA